MEARVELTGGCIGHFSEDDYCECDPAGVHVEFNCPKSSPGEYKQVKKEYKFFKNKNICKQQPVKVDELSDQYSIARWLTEHYAS